ncbi:MAG: hypothetical protein IJB15_04910, partial [Clostridia bacterium]|nr:hypothetical protein [Clostridia bacterium]
MAKNNMNQNPENEAVRKEQAEAASPETLKNSGENEAEMAPAEDLRREDSAADTEETYLPPEASAASEALLREDFAQTGEIPKELFPAEDEEEPETDISAYAPLGEDEDMGKKGLLAGIFAGGKQKKDAPEAVD